MSRENSFDPALMALRGRIGAHVAHARHDPHEMTARARAVFQASFEERADPSGVLTPEERARRAGHLRQAHFARLAYFSAVSRSRARSSRPASTGVRRASGPVRVPKAASRQLPAPIGRPNASTDVGEGGRP